MCARHKAITATNVSKIPNYMKIGCVIISMANSFIYIRIYFFSHSRTDIEWSHALAANYKGIL